MSRQESDGVMSPIKKIEICEKKSPLVLFDFKFQLIRKKITL